VRDSGLINEIGRPLSALATCLDKFGKLRSDCGPAIVKTEVCVPITVGLILVHGKRRVCGAVRMVAEGDDGCHKALGCGSPARCQGVGEDDALLRR
jgi:hypothetical protein